MSEPKLVPCICKKCGRHIVETLPGSDVRCPKCLAWTTVAITSKKDADAVKEKAIS